MGPVLEGPNWLCLKRRYDAWGKESGCWGERAKRASTILPRWPATTTSGKGITEPTGIVVLRAAKVTRRGPLPLLLFAAGFVAQAASAHACAWRCHWLFRDLGGGCRNAKKRTCTRLPGTSLWELSSIAHGQCHGASACFSFDATSDALSWAARCCCCCYCYCCYRYCCVFCPAESVWLASRLLLLYSFALSPDDSARQIRNVK